MILNYSKLTSPFNQSKIYLHKDKLEELAKAPITVPVTCEVDLTDGFCNNKCKHCFFGTDQKFQPVINPLDTVKNLLLELKTIGVKGIEFSGGGEPLTHPQIEQILKFVQSQKIELGIVTNGLLLNKIFNYISTLKFLRISLDAATPETYNIVHGCNEFDTVIKNVSQLPKYINPLNVGIGFLIVPENVEDIVEAARLAKNLGVRYIQYRPASLTYSVDDSIWNTAKKYVDLAIEEFESDDFQIFEPGIKWFHLNENRNYKKCYTSSLVSVVKANGDIPLCVLKRNEENSLIGNIKNGGFENNWYSKRHLELIENNILSECRKPCKHDSYNIAFETIQSDLVHTNFI